MSQKQFKAMRKLATLQTVGKPGKVTRALYKQLTKGYKRQSAAAKKLFSTGLTPWTMAAIS